jgi:hypothetical protein
LQFPRARAAYEYLITEAIYSSRAKTELQEKLDPYKNRFDLFITNTFGKDPITLHRKFQFQLAQVDGTFAQKINLLLSSNIERDGAPDDLTGALGSFNFYAAIGAVRFSRDVVSHKMTAEITGIWVYVKDNYSFTDKQGERSQYLGHWSYNGVIVVPLSAVAATSTYIPHVECPIVLPYINAPVTLGDPLIKGNVHHPIHNNDF